MSYTPPAASRPPSWLALAWLVVWTLACVYAASPPSTPLSASAEATLARVASAPHPAGSVANTQLQAWLVEELRSAGLTVELQSTTILSERWGLRGANLTNLLGCRAGTDSTGTLLLVSHHDSAPGSFGAADAGSGVTAVLEAARTVGPGRNDLCVLLTDAEEAGLLGAEAFAKQHPRFEDVAAILNFEARGVSGPAVMFHTGPQSGGLIDVLADVPGVVTSSLGPSVFALLPNDTDLSALSGPPGLDFAFVGGLRLYHSALDRLDRLDRRSVAHEVALAHGLTSRLIDEDLRALPGPEPVYFSTPLGLVRYPAHFALPLSGLVLVGVLLGLGRGRLGPALPGGLGALGLGVLVLLVPAGLWYAVAALVPAEAVTGGADSRFAGTWRFLVILSVLLTALGASAWGVRRLGRGVTGVAPIWAIGAGVVAWLAPGASYVFTVPALGAALLLLTEDRDSTVILVIRIAVSVAVVAVLVPLGLLLLPTLPLVAAGGALLLPALFIPVAAPTLDRLGLLPRPRGPLLGALATTLLTPLVILVLHLVQPPELPVQLAYATDSDGRAVWLSADSVRSGWLGTLVPDDADSEDLSDWLGWRMSVARAEAPPGAPGPTIVLEGVESAGVGGMAHRVRVVPTPDARVLVVVGPPGSRIVQVQAGENTYTPLGARRSLTWTRPPVDGLRLWVAGSGPIHTTELVDGWPVTPPGSEVGGWFSTGPLSQVTLRRSRVSLE